ncbi:ABC transporter permease [Lachnoclostridium sp. An14]|uniref:ABC transporter permease n=1 Tax=Lachnoclostridium sp. An14 TaxID=1965562 RepID=UPI000B38C096|nr:ABC transporter permease [Lachnoclostridium sp. An14]OUQ16618.1 ABC transporter permease [Lachnoclostridium sp. An14]
MFTLDWFANFGFSVFRLSTPLIFAALAAVINKKAGMLNMALEGMMLSAALGGVVFAGATNNVWIGLVGAVVIGVIVGWVIAFANISGQTDLYLTCIAVNLAATGGTVFAMFLLTGEKATTSAAIKAYTLPSITIPLIDKIPLIGPMVSGHNVLTYFSFISIFLVWFFLYKTRLGLRMRAVGENPQAASSVGINVKKIGYISFLIAGVLCGFGGAFMSMGWVSFFMKNMINGRGYIGLSAMNIAEGNPIGSGIAAVFFGFSDALATTLKSQGGTFPTEFLDMIPYAATIIALVVISSIRMSHLKKIQRGGK